MINEFYWNLDSLEELVQDSNMKLTIGTERLFAPEFAATYDYLGKFW